MAINKVQYELLLKQKEKLKKTENQLWAGIIIILIIFYFIFGLIIGFLGYLPLFWGAEYWIAHHIKYGGEYWLKPMRDFANS